MATRRIFFSLLAFAMLIAFLRYVPGVNLPPHPIWDFYGPPPIASDMPWNFTQRAGFMTERLRKSYSSRAPVGDLVKELRAQGFKIDEGSSEARYSWVGYGCLCQLMINWRPQTFSQGDRSPIDGIDVYFFPFAPLLRWTP